MKRTRLTALLLTGALAAMTPLSALATTPPCTPINNTATVAYNVGGVGQAPVADAAPEFNVGVKVMVAVANNDGNEVTVVPSPTINYALKFTVTNNGSAVQDYDLTAEPAVSTTPSPYGGNNDSFNGTTVAIYADAVGGTAGVFDATDFAAGTITTLNDVAKDGGSKVVFIVYSPTDLQESNLETAVYYLKATSKWADDSAITFASVSPTAAQAGGVCDGTISIDVVAGDVDGPATADILNDGEASDDGAFEVSSATIGVTKTSTVIWDPINLGVGAKAIPGAIVRYSVAIANTGGSSAVVTTIEDTLENSLQIDATADNADWAVTGSTRATITDTLTADTGDLTVIDGLGHVNTALVGGKLTATLTTILAADGANGYAAGELKAGETVTVSFNATIQ